MVIYTNISYRYAATISTIKACNFIDFIIIQFYNNFKKTLKAT